MTAAQRARWFIAALCLQLLLVAGMGLWKQSIVWRGREITLEASPVDPWDPFRGDYVALGYSVGKIPESMLRDRHRSGHRDVKIGDVIYVTLIRDGAYWHARQAMMIKPTDDVFLRGRVESIEFDQTGKPSQLRLTYGIESWFVQRGEGRKIENVQRGTRPTIAATVSVTPEGVAILRRARVAGFQLPTPENTIIGPTQYP